jgi:hypothetical protein
MDPNPEIAAKLTAFSAWAEMHDGSTRRLTIYGFGDTYQQRLTDAKAQAAQMPELKGARIVVIR